MITTIIAPPSAPEMCEIPPKIAPVSNRNESARVKPDGETNPTVAENDTPARPAKPELTVKASTLLRAGFMPQSAAAVSWARTARHCRPSPLEVRLTATTTAMIAQSAQIQKSHL